MSNKALKYSITNLPEPYRRMIEMLIPDEFNEVQVVNTAEYEESKVV